MPIDVYRCSSCRREVLVRSSRPMSPAEAQRRVEEELRAATRGPRGRIAASFQLRDDIWLGLSQLLGGDVPRSEVPDECPACGRHDTLSESRTIE
ncbi:MAG: hypothetical protein OXH97_10345 [Chloroflexota bacterium]|nr:hypothetical protein [Chloroflexota bacterium]MDE2696896.1 hypothetical protein [Chloroflexota bacterium]MXZ47399.1 hypothetical protein [Chloroflexota bacterium]MXZ63336.1 hypothetical protein [Chloroflexota bacterium]MYE31687.1 hypothetical protein [Chloroflexota bacterium]